MKKLQNNFTTPEQSKRLLALGVPAWTADCYYYEEGGISKDSTPNILSLGDVWTDESNETMFSSYVDVPCWSVGRLMEIYITCIEHYTGDERLTVGIDTIRLGIMDCIIAAIEVGCDDGDLEFSKLED